MKYVVQDLHHQKLEFPVICGGAALTRKYVEDDLRREYTGGIFYADDAFAGLHIMEDLASPNGAREKRIAEGKVVKEFARAAVAGAAKAAAAPSRTSRFPRHPIFRSRRSGACVCSSRTISICAKSFSTSMRPRCSRTSGS